MNWFGLRACIVTFNKFFSHMYINTNQAYWGTGGKLSVITDLTVETPAYMYILCVGVWKLEVGIRARTHIIVVRLVVRNQRLHPLSHLIVMQAPKNITKLLSLTKKFDRKTNALQGGQWFSQVVRSFPSPTKLTATI